MTPTSVRNGLAGIITMAPEHDTIAHARQRRAIFGKMSRKARPKSKVKVKSAAQSPLPN
jgi:hypothetical protein